MEFFAVRHQQFREPSVIQCSAVTGTSPKPTCSLISLISRRGLQMFPDTGSYYTRFRLGLVEIQFRTRSPGREQG